MAKVIAQMRGYFGGIVREVGEAFGIDDEIMDDPKRRPRWVKEAGASDEVAEVEETNANADADADADDKPKTGKGKAGRKSKAETIQAPEAKPFADAPTPIRAKSEINDALGTTQPDWLAPGAPVAVTD
ncbi:hypothetical protein [Mesorhizobium sp. M0296]|uniref:hypothetical protein n=1 Tax=Mesorhizobium sp. M0296 TaxID=2956931 RepID=UPI00333BD067